MTIPSPLQTTLEQLEVDYTAQHDVQREGAATGQFNTPLLSEFLPWGESGCGVLATTGIVELEYAALQKSAAIYDASSRGTIELSGEDRLECIHRLTTQKLVDMKTGESRLAFITSRRGGVLADVIVHIFPDTILIDLDCTAVEQVFDHLNSYIVMEDVQVQNTTENTHWLWILGPESNKHLPKDGLPLRCQLSFWASRGLRLQLAQQIRSLFGKIA